MPLDVIDKDLEGAVNPGGVGGGNMGEGFLFQGKGLEGLVAVTAAQDLPTGLAVSGRPHCRGSDGVAFEFVSERLCQLDKG